jgi:hypothetical protein
LKRTFYTLSIALLVGVLFFSGCANPFDSKPDSGEAQGNLGRIAIQVGSPARTLQPELSGFSKYELAFTGPAGASHETKTIDTGTTAEVDLVPGAWTIAVTAFAGTGDAAKTAAQGSATVTVTANQTVDAAITLTPYTAADAAPGTLRYSVTYPAGIKAGTLVITKADSTAVEGGTINLLQDSTNNSKTETLPFTAGQYKMQIRLTAKDDMIAGRTEALHIYPTLTSTAEYTFTTTDFVAFAEMADVSITGTATMDTTGTAVNADVAITLYNDSFKDGFVTSDNLTTWITNLPGGLSAKSKAAVDGGDTEITLSITETPTEAKSDALVITIPGAVLSSGKDLIVRDNPNAKYAIGLPDASAAVADVDLSAETEKQLNGEVEITLSNDRFTAIAQSDSVKEWFTNLPSALNAVVKTVAQENKIITVSITGTPADVLAATTLAITIPGTALNRGEAITVTANANAKITVTENTMRGVYIVGRVGNGSTDNPFIGHSWKYNKEEGTSIAHDTLQAESEKNAIFSAVAVGDDVHLAGIRLDSGSGVYVYRKNNNDDITLSVENEYFSMSPVMAVDGDVAYVIIIGFNGVYCWIIEDDGSHSYHEFSKNFSKMTWSANITCVSVDENYLYFGGTDRFNNISRAVYWKYDKTTNTLGDAIILNSETAGVVYSMAAVGDTLYLAGNTYSEDSKTTYAAYWTVPKTSSTINETIVEPNYHSSAKAIAVSDNGDVHLTGYWRPANAQPSNQYYGAIAAYWKVSGGTVRLDKLTEQRGSVSSSALGNYDEGLSIAVDGADVYIAGYIKEVSGTIGPTKPVYWKYAGDTLQPPVELAPANAQSQALAIVVR